MRLLSTLLAILFGLGQVNIMTNFEASPLLCLVQDEGLKKLLMSWYYAGYYTGFYEGQQQQQNSKAKLSNEPRAQDDAFACISKSISVVIIWKSMRLSSLDSGFRKLSAGWGWRLAGKIRPSARATVPT